MLRPAPTRLLLAAITLTLAASLPAQNLPPPVNRPRTSPMPQFTPPGNRPESTLPPTAPTAQPPAPSAPQPSAQITPATPAVPAPTPVVEQPPARHADVAYADGQLTIKADNSSLNQILRDISRQTGMKITGGVTDERVFGAYGPDTPAKILATLLDGTGSNMLIVENDGPAPSELILSPRHGGPTPPNPNAVGFNDTGEAEPPPNLQPQAQPRETRNSLQNPAVVASPAQTAAFPNINQPPADANSTTAAPATSNSTAPTDSTQQQSPNGVKTPQQIYEELQRLRQQNQQPAPQ